MSNFRLFSLIALILTASVSFAKDYIIYSIVQDLPMGEPNELIKKNYYVNIGEKQGAEIGTKLDVVRNISRLDPYENKTRYNYSVKIGELEVIHSEGNSSICKIAQLEYQKEEAPLFEVRNLMIGDKVKVSVGN